jgi:hypothetical protein
MCGIASAANDSTLQTRQQTLLRDVEVDRGVDLSVKIQTELVQNL